MRLRWPASARPAGWRARLAAEVGMSRCTDRVYPARRMAWPLLKSSAEVDNGMSFQAYLDNIRATTGKTPEQFKALAMRAGVYKPDMKAGALVAWLKKEFDLGHGHSMAVCPVFKDKGRFDSPKGTNWSAAASTDPGQRTSPSCSPMRQPPNPPRNAGVAHAARRPRSGPAGCHVWLAPSGIVSSLPCSQ